jgi:hypothetical protein
MGNKMEKVFDKIDEWAAWRWANAKVDKEIISILKQIVNISKENMEDYNLAMFTHAMDFFRKCVNFEKLVM